MEPSSSWLLNTACVLTYKIVWDFNTVLSTMEGSSRQRINKEIVDLTKTMGFPSNASGEEPTCQCRRCKTCKFALWVRTISWRRKWQMAPVFLPRKFNGQRSLVGYSIQGCSQTRRSRCMHMRAHTHTHTDHMILKDIHWAFHPATKTHTFSSSTHETFSKRGHTFGHKPNLNKFKKI